MNKKFTLLMTACIQPTASNFNPNHRTNALIRLNDYKISLRYWLKYTHANFWGIVFVENSGFDLGELRELVASENVNNIKVEFLQQIATPIPLNLHYGYSELEMIDFAFDNSLLINSTDYVIKATGRLYFPKLGLFLKRMPQEFKILIDSRDYELVNIRKHYLVTTLFIVEKEFYKDILKDSKSRMNDQTVHIERLYYSILKPMYKDNVEGIILRFPFSLNPVGFGAHWNVNYNSPKKILASKFRDILRVLMPRFWV